MNSEFWRGRRVFLSGHTGFKGSWLAVWLAHLGADVFGYSLDPPTQPSMYEAVSAGRGLQSHIGDVRDAPGLRSAMEAFRPEVVLHLAAQAIVRESYANPIETFDVNVMGVAHVLETVRHVSSVRAVVVVTSDKCYANQEWVWGYRESDPMGGNDPYSSSKGCAELVAAAFASSFFPAGEYSSHGVAVGTARAGNVIGGGDWGKDRLVPDVIYALHEGQPVTLRNPNAVRPFQFVLEPLRGYLMLAEALYVTGPEYSGGWNFGPSAEDIQSVAWLARRAAEAWGGQFQWEQDGAPQPHEAHFLKLDCAKARALLKWTPRCPLAVGLDLTVEWYRAFYSQSSDCSELYELTLRQIEQYEAALAEA